MPLQRDELSTPVAEESLRRAHVRQAGSTDAFRESQTPRVLHVGKFYPPHPGGMEAVLGDLCGALAGLIPVEVVVANHRLSSRQDVINGVPVTRLGRWGEILSTSLLPGLIRFLKEDRWDIVHIHHPNPMAAVAFLAAAPSGRLVVTYHSDIVRQRVTGLLFGPTLRRVLSRCDRVHVASQELIDSSPVLRHFRDRATVIPFGIQEERVVTLSPAAREQAAEFADWGRGSLALFVGRIVYYKGLDYLLRAMTRVDGRLLVIGQGNRLKSARRLAARLSLSDRVRFLGGADDETRAAALHACQLLVLPSIARSEAFGLVLLEAMAAGKPVITTSLRTGVSFVNREGETGLVVPPGDAEALAKAVARILGDAELRTRLSRGALARFKSEFGVELEAKRMLRLYREVLARPPRNEQGANQSI